MAPERLTNGRTVPKEELMKTINDATPKGMALTGVPIPQQDLVLSPDALAFLAKLQRAFGA